MVTLGEEKKKTKASEELQWQPRETRSRWGHSQQFEHCAHRSMDIFHSSTLCTQKHGRRQQLKHCSHRSMDIFKSSTLCAQKHGYIQQFNTVHTKAWTYSTVQHCTHWSMTIFQKACGTRRLGHKTVKAPLSQNGKDPSNGRCHSEMVNPTYPPPPSCSDSTA